MVPLTDLHLRAARAKIAEACAPAPVAARLGTVCLRADQRASAARVLDALARRGGCVLADDVGRGKTYVALAVARSWTRPLVVAPAALRSTWREAMRRAGVSCTLVSHEALSRGHDPGWLPDGIIVDESHHFRSSRTRRHAVLAKLSVRARLLLISATPLQNRTRDLAAQIALFHGARSFGLDGATLAAFVVRGAGGSDVLPEVAPPTWLRPDADDGAVLEAILALPPPARPHDGGDQGVLRTIGLVRAWASSRAALRAAIRRRRRVAAAMEQSALDGRIPSRRDLAAWRMVGQAIQLGFPPMLATADAGGGLSAEVLRCVEREHAALAALERAIGAASDPDEMRIQALVDVRAAHAGESVLAFTELASTAQAYFARLRHVAQLGLLTAREARIASGRVPRDALLARFAPRARHVAPPPERERITLLIATDLLSEGLDLQDASVVVHLDLPWNPARMAQRVGRVRRPGGAAAVHSYLIAPPARAGLLLDVEQRLRRKLAETTRTIGRGIEVLPSLSEKPDPPSDHIGYATARGETAERISRWARAAGAPARRGDASVLVAGVASLDAGWLASLDDGRLVASIGDEPPDTGSSVARVVPLCEGAARPLVRREADAALARCRAWIEEDRLAREFGCASGLSMFDTALERRLTRALRSTPRHLRPAVAIEVARLTAHFSVPRPLGAERAMHRLLDRAERESGSSWLPEAADLVRGAPALRGEPGRSPRVLALVITAPPSEPAPAT